MKKEKIYIAIIHGGYESQYSSGIADKTMFLDEEEKDFLVKAHALITRVLNDIPCEEGCTPDLLYLKNHLIDLVDCTYDVHSRTRIWEAEENIDSLDSETFKYLRKLKFSEIVMMAEFLNFWMPRGFDCFCNEIDDIEIYKIAEKIQ